LRVEGFRGYGDTLFRLRKFDNRRELSGGLGPGCMFRHFNSAGVVWFQGGKLVHLPDGCLGESFHLAARFPRPSFPVVVMPSAQAVAIPHLIAVKVNKQAGVPKVRRAEVLKGAESSGPPARKTP
jgi:hypothetical protein